MAHAPQFFTLPESEDKKTVAKVKRLAQANGKRLKALKPDVFVTISNDHANQFVLHCVPPFALHRGDVAAGMLGERKPDMVSFDPSWHHNYATLAWWKQPTGKEKPFEPHYPAIAPDRLDLSIVLHRLANDSEQRDRYAADRNAYVAQLDLTKKEKSALLNLKDKEMVALGVHPFMSFMARLHIERAAKKP